jgi:hypothetical protein
MQRHTRRPMTTIIKTAINRMIKIGHSNPPILTANIDPNFLVLETDFYMGISAGRLKNLDIKLRVFVSCEKEGLLAAR